VVYEIGNGQVTTDSSLPSFSLTEGAILSFLMDAKCTGNSAGSGTAIAVKFTPLAAGTFVLEPSVSSVAALTPFTEAFTWTVPTPFNWHRLTNLELRIRDANNIILWIRFNEADRTFSLFNDAAHRFGPSFSAGANVKLQTSSAELDLGRTSVVAAGPTSPTVTLNLGLEFLPSAAGKIYSVEVAALDDSGNADGFIAAGLLTVLPLR
jgi:hypothetical protein